MTIITIKAKNLTAGMSVAGRRIASARYSEDLNCVHVKYTDGFRANYAPHLPIGIAMRNVSPEVYRRYIERVERALEDQASRDELNKRSAFAVHLNLAMLDLEMLVCEKADEDDARRVAAVSRLVEMFNVPADAWATTGDAGVAPELPTYYALQHRTYDWHEFQNTLGVFADLATTEKAARVLYPQLKLHYYDDRDTEHDVLYACDTAHLWAQPFKLNKA